MMSKIESNIKYRIYTTEFNGTTKEEMFVDEMVKPVKQNLQTIFPNTIKYGDNNYKITVSNLYTTSGFEQCKANGYLKYKPLCWTDIVVEFDIESCEMDLDWNNEENHEFITEVEIEVQGELEYELEKFIEGYKDKFFIEIEDEYGFTTTQIKEEWL